MEEKELIQRAIELCLAVYRVTDKFPTDEILREKLKSASLDIVEGIIYDLEKGPTNESRFFNSRKLNSVLACFDIAARQNWVRAKNFDILRIAYQALYSCNRDKNEKSRQGEQKKTRDDLTKRQHDIIRFLEQHKDGANLADLSGVLKISKRSINRELLGLTARGIVGKKGVTKGAKFNMALSRQSPPQ